MSYEKPSKGEVHMILDAWYALREALAKIEREVDGVGPDCTLEFHKLALASVRNIARAAQGKKG